MNDDENTYYLGEIPSLVKHSKFLQKEYNDTGFLGRKLIETPWLSDNTKLNLIQTAKPEYKKHIDIIKTSLPYIKKGKNIHDKYLSSSDKDVNEQYNLHLNSGGKKRRKSKTRKTLKKKSNYSKKTKSYKRV